MRMNSFGNESQNSIFNTKSALHQQRNMKANGLALLGVVVTIGIVSEHCAGLK